MRDDVALFSVGLLFIVHKKKRERKREEKTMIDLIASVGWYLQIKGNYLKRIFTSNNRQPKKKENNKISIKSIPIEEIDLFLIYFNCVIILHFELLGSFIIIDAFTIEKKSSKKRKTLSKIGLAFFYTPQCCYTDTWNATNQ